MILGNWLGGWPSITGHHSSQLFWGRCVLYSHVDLIFHGWPIFGIMLLFIGLGDGVVMTVVNSFAANVTPSAVAGYLITYISG